VEGCRLVLQRTGDGSPIHRLVGELDLFDANDLSLILRPVLLTPDAVLDLDGLAFADLAGCRALLALVGPPDGERVIASPGTPCGRLLGWLDAVQGDGPDTEPSVAASV
jgi:hypothetical protein